MMPFLLYSKPFFWVNIVKHDECDTFSSEAETKKWATKAVAEVVKFLTQLAISEDFSFRQSYCQICACLARTIADGSSEEVEFLGFLLVDELLPHALVMKDDRVTNVRLTLAKCLHFMPSDIQTLTNVSEAITLLDNEAHTWEGVAYPHVDQRSNGVRRTFNRFENKQSVVQSSGANGSDLNNIGPTKSDQDHRQKTSEREASDSTKEKTPSGKKLEKVKTPTRGRRTHRDGVDDTDASNVDEMNEENNETNLTNHEMGKTPNYGISNEHIVNNMSVQNIFADNNQQQNDDEDESSSMASI